MIRTPIVMRCIRSAVILASTIAVLGCESSPPTADQPWSPDQTEVQELHRDVSYLASDPLEGRGVGTPGLDKAADFLADHDRSLGLRTLPGLDGYFQPFSFTLAATVGPRTSLQLNGVPLERGKDFNSLPISASGDFTGPLIFAGYGVTDPSHNYDDYANLDVHGKIVLAMRFEPHNTVGQSRFTNSLEWSASSALMVKAENAKRHGAAALILVNPPTFHGIDLLLVPTLPHAPQATLPVLQVSQKAIAKYLDLKSLQSQIDTDGKPHSLSLDQATLSGTVDLIRNQTTVKNVIACLPGYGPHADEYVVVGAHYDHLGHGGFGSLAIGSHQIHHGADDNASGTAAIMELAQRLTRAGRLPRSILFCNFTAEEEGLIGSAYFVNHPPIPLDKIVAMLNLDMVGRIRDERLYIGGAGTADAFDTILSSADAGLPLNLHESGPYIGRGGFGPSDHMSFAQKKIPVLFLFSGMHADYHRPTDTADKVNYQGIDQAVELSARILNEMATMPHQPYIAKFDSLAGMGGATGDSNGRRAALGVIPDYGTDDTTPGVKIMGTHPGSAAEQAGMRSGDILIQIGPTRIESLNDLEEYLEKAKPGDKVHLIFLRDKTFIETSAILTERSD
jgi:Zn-dependent M28 family amino/carboxypeptidase